MKTFELRPDAPSAPAVVPDAAEELLGGLNPVQGEAARTTEGPVMIVAGPGSGEMRTLCIARLAEAEGLDGHALAVRVRLA